MSFGPVKYRTLKQTHPRLHLRQIRCLKALYYGGARLLFDGEVLSEILTRYTHEKDSVYDERKRRAYYENIFAQVINQISAGLAQDPVRLDDATGVDQYWIDILDDATPFSEDGSKRKTFDQVCRDSGVEALVCGWSWLQADLPAPVDPEEAPTTLAEQEQSGGLRSYLVPWPTECVIDWEEKKGQLVWLRTYECGFVAQSPTEPRDTKVHTWTIWGSDTWTRYEIVENTRLGQQLPNDDVEINPAISGTHTFGRVPWVRLDLCSEEGVRLHIGDQIESLCRSYFNRQNGEAFQWIQYYFQQLYEFLAPEISGIDNPVSDAQQDPSRARRTRAPGEVQVRGSEDKAMFVGPSMAGASEGRSATQDMRDAIYRATAQMALSQDTKGAMIRRSAESKKQDTVVQEILLGAIGKKILTMAGAAASLLARGRGDEEAPKLRGYERFDIQDADMLIERAAVVETMNIPSATYQIERKYQLALADLGDSIDETTKKEILKELKQAITQDSLMSQASGLDEDDDEDDEDDDEEEVEDENEEEEAPSGDPFKRKNPFE